MPRVNLTVTNVPSHEAQAPVAITFDDGDAANDQQVTLTGYELVLVRNAAGTAKTVTAKGAACDHGRSVDLAEALAAGAVAVLPYFRPAGWRQSTGKLHLDPEDDNIKIAVLRLPR